jgi:histidinol-phosphate/aromatic aminotransferase/cobyric acid decarboxylase-like protein
MRELRVFPSNANFLMIGVRGERCCGEFGRYLLDQGVAIRDLSGLPGCGPGFYRIGLRSRPDNARLVLSASKYFGVRV